MYELQPTPDFVRDAFKLCGLVEKYEERPAYQRNDYMLWINVAKSAPTGKIGWTRCWTNAKAAALYEDVMEWLKCSHRHMRLKR